MSKKHLHIRLLVRSVGLATVAASLLGAASVASAQLLEEIIVTAQKREQAASDIPVALTTFNEDDIRDLNMSTPLDLAAHTPGLVTNDFVVPTFSIRGVGLDDYNYNNASPVAVYIDQAYASSPAFLKGQLFDISQIEVLKGPQGTLFGRNATGGAITFVSNKPTEETEGYVDVIYGRFDQFEAQAAISGSLSENTQGRLALSSAMDSGGYQTNQVTGNDLGERDAFSGRALLAWQPSDSLDILLNVHASKDDTTPIAGINPTMQPTWDFVFGTNFPLDRENAATGPDPAVNEQGYGGSIDLSYDTDAGTLVSVTTFESYDVDGNAYDQDGNSLVGSHTTDFSDIETWSQELRWSSETDGGLSWMVGLTVAEDSTKGMLDFNMPTLLDVLLITPFADGGFELPFNGFPNTDLFAARGNTGGGAGMQYDQEIKSYGVFVHTEYPIGDLWKLTAGLRYTSDDVSFSMDAVDTTILGAYQADMEALFALPAGSLTGVGLTSLIAGAPVLTDQAWFSLRPDDVSEDYIDWKVALDYSPDDVWMFYGSASLGHKGGRYFVGPMPDASFYPYVPTEELFSVELGFKARFDTVAWNGTVFSYDYEDRQSVLSVVAPGFGSGVIIGTLPKSEMFGFELDFHWMPAEGLNIKGGYSYIDSEAKTDADAFGNQFYNVFLGAPDSGIKGGPLGQAPERSYNVLVSYEFDVSDNLYTRLQADHAYRSEQQHWLGMPADQGYSDDMANTGARFALGAIDGQWEIALFGKNLMDNDDVYLRTNAFSGGVVELHTAPRTYGVQARINF